MRRILPISALLLIFVSLPRPAAGQRFGGDFGAGGGVWIVYVAPDLEPGETFQRDVADVVGIGGRGFLQTGRVRLGGGAFGGSFTDEGLNPDGNKVEGGLSAGGFTAEYLIRQANLEIVAGGMVGGGVLTVEERLSVDGDVEELRRRRQGIVVGYPWARLAYNPAPFVNAGLQVGYLFGTEGVGGFAIGIDVMVGLIP